MKRFLKNLLIHPSTWVAGGVILVGCCIAFPPVAPILAPIAVGSFAASVPTFIPYLKGFNLTKHDDSLVDNIKHFFTKHPFQATVLVLTLLAFIAALVLTIGFFTGGAGFAFMAPLLAVGGSSLFGPALLGFATVMAPLTIGNNLKRFLGWLDSFTRDGAAETVVKNNSSLGTIASNGQSDSRPLISTQWTKQNRVSCTENLTKDSPIEYLQLFGRGVKATVLPVKDIVLPGKTINKGWFTSPDAELLEKCEVKRP